VAYVAKENLYGELPEAVVTDALDDDRDGDADDAVAALVCDGASQAVDSYLQVRYAVPLDDPPALVLRAAKVFALETLYHRRELKDFPLAAEAKSLRERLQLIAEGRLPLDVATEPANSPGSALTEPLRGSGDALL
jgi:phage gp36-like protein